MDPNNFFAASRLVVVAGKGGVGKTTVTAVLARAAARHGRRVLVVDVEGRPGLAGLLGGEAEEVLDFEERVLAGEPGPGTVKGRSIRAGRALAEYLGTQGFGRLTRRLARSGVFDVVATAAPGIEDLLVLGKVKQLERDGEHDLIVLDAPAAGHAIPFLQAAATLLDTVDGGPIRTQAREVAEMLADPGRCQVLLVTLAEETPVNELIETSFALEDRVGVALAPVVVNAVLGAPPGLAEIAPGLPSGPLAAAAEFRLRRAEGETAQLTRLAGTLPLPRIVLPYAPDGLGPGALGPLIDSFLDGIGTLP